MHLTPRKRLVGALCFGLCLSPLVISDGAPLWADSTPVSVVVSVVGPNGAPVAGACAWITPFGVNPSLKKQVAGPDGRVSTSVNTPFHSSLAWMTGVHGVPADYTASHLQMITAMLGGVFGLVTQALGAVIGAMLVKAGTSGSSATRDCARELADSPG
jgi:hypothetical protein